ncbi:MAG: hypothetical protein ACK55Z_01500, partial [bacterium]
LLDRCNLVERRLLKLDICFEFLVLCKTVFSYASIDLLIDLSIDVISARCHHHLRLELFFPSRSLEFKRVQLALAVFTSNKS